MDEGLKELLQANLEVSKENNKILKKMRNAQRWAQVTRVLYYLVIVGLTVGAFYYVQPFLQKFLDLIPGFNKLFGSLPDFSQLNNLLPR